MKLCVPYVLGMFLVSSAGYAGQVANVKYIHDYINQKHSVSIDIENTSQLQIANMKYLLCTADVANQKLNGAVPSVTYCNHALATQQAVDTSAVIGVVDSLISLSSTGDPYLHLAIADRHEVYTYSSEFNAAYPAWYWDTVTFTQSIADDLFDAGISPGYFVQAQCSTNFGYYASTEVASTDTVDRHCWCRAKRKVEAQNSDWVYAYNLSSGSACRKSCPEMCATSVMNSQDFMEAVFAPWII